MSSKWQKPFTAVGVLMVISTQLPAAELQSSPPASEAAAPTSNSALAAVPANTWRKVAGFAPAPKGILAYSGGAFDTRNGQFLIFGGGHADYWGNEVCAFSPAMLNWKKMYEPDARERYTNDNIDNVRGKLKDSDRPYTRHTYNQLCFVTTTASLFIFGGCGPGWGSIKPTCPSPPDCWSYSFKDNRWSQLYAGPGSPTGDGFACCYDSKRNVVWAYSGIGDLRQFDLAGKVWSAHPLKADVKDFGTYNYQLTYLPKSDRVLLIGSGQTGTIDPNTFTIERHALENCSGKAGVAYLPEHEAAVYVTLPGEGLDYRMAVFDCAKGQWHDWQAEGKPTSDGVLWDRLQYDPADKVVLLVSADGVWAYKPPAAFEFGK
jgi:hypothetical protein